MICRYPVRLPRTNDCGEKFDIYVPCQKCAWCARQRRNEWFIRFLEESKTAIYTRFVTLDYRDEDLPYSVDETTGELLQSCSLRDIQLYHKHLRNKWRFRFFLASEYGKQTNRPHYHGIYWSNEKIPFYDEWPHGEHGSDLPATVGSFKYVTKYLLKGSYVPSGATPNFHVMSRKPGIGSGFLSKVTDNQQVYHYYDKKMKLPTFYKRKYINQLSEDHRNLIRENSLDYLSQQPMYGRALTDLWESNAPDGQSIHDFIADLYRKDYLKQLQINKS